MRRFWRATVGFVLTGVFLLAAGGLTANWWVKSSCGQICLSAQADAPTAEADAILILGAAAWGDEPSPILQQRLDRGIEIWRKNPHIPLLLSGDGHGGDLSETAVMSAYVRSAGVPQQKIFIDPKGYSTYESMGRAVNTFGAESLVVVTQEYHLPRAIYLAKSLGLDVIGVASFGREQGQYWRDAREIVARIKAWIYGQMQPSIPADGPVDLQGDPITL